MERAHADSDASGAFRLAMVSTLLSLDWSSGSQTTESRVQDAERQFQEQRAAREAPKVALVRKALEHVESVSIEGHLWSPINGVYRKDSEHDGWPVLKCVHNKRAYSHVPAMYIYRYRLGSAWRLGPQLNFDEDLCSATVSAVDGQLPVGAHTWSCWDPDEEEFRPRTLTVTLQ